MPEKPVACVYLQKRPQLRQPRSCVSRYGIGSTHANQALLLLQNGRIKMAVEKATMAESTCPMQQLPLGSVIIRNGKTLFRVLLLILRSLDLNLELDFN
jgi:hypothetical protein